MKQLAKRFWNDEQGAVLSAELVILSTVGVMGISYGVHNLVDAVNAELDDCAAAIRSLDQMAYMTGSPSAFTPPTTDAQFNPATGNSSASGNSPAVGMRSR